MRRGERRRCRRRARPRERESGGGSLARGARSCSPASGAPCAVPRVALGRVRPHQGHAHRAQGIRGSATHARGEQRTAKCVRAAKEVWHEREARATGIRTARIVGNLCVQSCSLWLHLCHSCCVRSKTVSAEVLELAGRPGTYERVSKCAPHVHDEQVETSTAQPACSRNRSRIGPLSFLFIRFPPAHQSVAHSRHIRAICSRHQLQRPIGPCTGAGRMHAAWLAAAHRGRRSLPSGYCRLTPSLALCVWLFRVRRTGR